jgi:hypothetical protein
VTKNLDNGKNSLLQGDQEYAASADTWHPVTDTKSYTIKNCVDSSNMYTSNSERHEKPRDITTQNYQLIVYISFSISVDIAFFESHSLELNINIRQHLRSLLIALNQ